MSAYIADLIYTLLTAIWTDTTQAVETNACKRSPCLLFCVRAAGILICTLLSKRLIQHKQT